VIGSASGRGPDIKTVRVEAAKTPLSSGPVAAAGLIEPLGVNVVRDGDISVDLSSLDEGYFFIKYEGPRSKLLFELIDKDHSENPPVYVYPTGKGWQGYALPHGPGEYTLLICARDADPESAQPDELRQLTFEADFAEGAPYKYRNAYAYYDEGSLAVASAAYLVDEETRNLGHPLTDAEKTAVLVRFVCENIASDKQLLSKLENGEQDFYFPDSENTLSTAKGLCGDRASLTAVMLKSQGIPTRLHNGYILKPLGNGEKEEAYHSWMSVYIDGGWHMYDPTISSEEIFDNRMPDPSCPTRTIDGRPIDPSVEYGVGETTIY
jgi:hypothetical protein